MSDPQRPSFDRQHPATDSQRPWIEESAVRNVQHEPDCELGKELKRDGRIRIFVDSGGPLPTIDPTTHVYVNWMSPCTCGSHAASAQPKKADMPPERAADPGALVNEARHWHYVVTGQSEQPACFACIPGVATPYPCLTARLADALEAALLAAREPLDEERQKGPILGQFVNKTGVDEEPIFAELLAAARAWRDVIGGTLTVPPQAYLDVEGRLASAVDALATSGEVG